MRTVIALFVSMIICAPALAGMKRLPASSFEVLSVEATWISAGWLQVVAEVKNVGKIPGLPVLQITGRDSDGKLIDSGDHFPFTSGNVQPGDTCAIKYPLTRNEKVKTVGVKVTGGMARY